MKKLILGLDGMDCDTAVKLNLENVLQLQFSKIAVPILEEVGVPNSPEVWASFLCAKHMKKNFSRKNGYVFNFLKKVKEVFPWLSFGISRKTCGSYSFPELGEKSWVDLQNVREFNSPYFSYSNKVLDIMADFGKTQDLEECQNRLEVTYQNKSKQLLDAIKSELKNPKSDVFFGYLHFPDAFNHVWYQNPQKIEYYHRKIDNFVSKVLDLTDGVHVIIISDHGFDFSNAVHSNFGFISSNQFMNFPRTIIDFGKVVYQYAGVSN